MRRRDAIKMLGALALCPPQRVSAQDRRVARVGWLTAQKADSLTPFIQALREGFVELGYAEDRNLKLVFRYGEDDLRRVPELVAELIQAPVDIVLVQGAAISIVNSIKLPVPVVFASSGDPVSAGFVESLARPGRNMTGVTFMAADLNGKRLELLRDLVPNLRRVAIIANPEHPGEHLERDYSERTSRQLGVQVDYYPTRSTGELTDAFAAMRSKLPQAISLFADGFAIQNRDRIIGFGMENKVPVISGWPVFAQSGAICTYGPRLTESYRRMASYVDRIFNGAKASELPVEQPTRFQLVVNMRTARALNIDVPSSVLVRADDIIE
jgi:putative tryptophan/tyrosine transport system substrate-binding protein